MYAEPRAFGPEPPPALPPALVTGEKEKDGRSSWASSAVSTLPEYGYTSKDAPPPFALTLGTDEEGGGERDAQALRSASPTSLSTWPVPPIGSDPGHGHGYAV